MKRMLINATQVEEMRVAIVDGQKLIDLDIEGPSSEQKKSNIYKGKITRVEPSLDAAFVDYGAERHGFLPLKEISREYFVKQPESGSKINIRDVLKEGQDIVVQIDKEERGNKGAALTTFISLAGRFVVLMPNNPRGGGVSRRIAGEERDQIRNTLKEIDLPEGQSVIVRTAGIGRSAEELKWDLDYLQGVWNAIFQVVKSRPSPFLIFQDSSPIVRALRDHLNSDIGEIIVDDDDTLKEAREFMEHAMPHNLRKLQRYEEPVPLFTRFQIESQIESAFSHSVSLPSGGSLVIDPTEALTSIDINSARATKGGDIEATALQTNLEAADEIARQCRLRDMGGLLVIDFIDMGPSRNQREVENRLRDAMRGDRARVQIGKISRFGLLEMSRQRMRQSLGESAHKVCPRCMGAGSIRSVESLGLSILRLIGEEARKDLTAKVIAELPVQVATYLLNEKRDWILDIEKRDKVDLLLVANPSLDTPHYTIRRVRSDQTELEENSGASYTLNTPEDDLVEAVLETSHKHVHEAPAVSSIKPATPAPTPQAKPVESKPALGLVGWIKKILFGDAADKSKKKPVKNDRRKSGDKDTRSGGRNRNRRNERSQDGRKRRGGRQNEQSKQKKAQPDNRKKKADAQAEQKPAQNQNANQNANQKGSEDKKDDQQQAQTGNSRRRRNRRRRRGGSGNQDKSDNQNQNQNQEGSQASEQQHGKPSPSPVPTPGDKPVAAAEPAKTGAASSTPKAAAPAKPADSKATESKSPESKPADSHAAKPQAQKQPEQQAPAASQKPAQPQQNSTEQKKPEQKNPEQSSEASNQPTNQDKKPASDKPAAKAQPQGDAKPAASKPEASGEKPANGERKLPWEASAPSGDGKPQRVWSSED